MPSSDESAARIEELRILIREQIGSEPETKPLRESEIQLILSKLTGTGVTQTGVTRLSEQLGEVLETDRRVAHPFRKATLVAIRDALSEVDDG